MEDRWNKLSMYDRNEFIKVAVLNGLRDPSEIRRKYNEFADGGFFEKLDLKVAEWEPTTNKIALASDAIGVLTAFTGYGAGAGAKIASLGNMPNTLIDSYLAGRDWYKTFTEDKSIKDALWNTGEAALGVLGTGIVGKGVKRLSDARFAETIATKKAEELARREGRYKFLKDKYGMTDQEIAAYAAAKATNAAMNSKDIADARKEAKDFNRKYTNLVSTGLSALLDGYHVIQDENLTLKAIDRAILEAEEDYPLEHFFPTPTIKYAEGGPLKASVMNISRI